MQIGVNGRGWVQMGAIGYKGAGGQANKASMHIYSDTAHAFRPYGREISPKNHIHVVQTSSCAGGCIGVIMYADGCGWTHGQGGKQK